MYRRSIAGDLNPGGKWTHVQKIMLLLVESGVVYCMLQVSFRMNPYLPGWGDRDCDTASGLDLESLSSSISPRLSAFLCVRYL